jgi:hypothetical protein
MGAWTFRKESFYVSNLSSQIFEHPQTPLSFSKISMRTVFVVGMIYF